ncbi:hypothetical protein SRABI27_00898 [Pedobacter sp. Bi27]|nr:hypothetical protein SRABI27_00898 [Pedobacter sp. Bi27]
MEKAVIMIMKGVGGNFGRKNRWETAMNRAEINRC